MLRIICWINSIQSTEAGAESSWLCWSQLVAQRPRLALRPRAALSPAPGCATGKSPEGARGKARSAWCRGPAGWWSTATPTDGARHRVPAGRWRAPAVRPASRSASAVEPAVPPGSELPRGPLRLRERKGAGLLRGQLVRGSRSVGGALVLTVLEGSGADP